MATDSTKLDDLEMLSLLAHGLISYMGRVAAGKKDPFPYPDALLRGFNQLLLTCALRDVPRAERPTSIPTFVATWATLPLTEWAVKLDIPADVFIGDRLLDPDYDGRPTALCRKLSRGEVMPRTVKGATIADRTANPKAIALKS
jgi:pPIWI_RE three-gene island domain Y